MDRIPIQPKCGRSGFFWVVESVGGAYQLGWGSYRLVVSLVPIGGGKACLTIGVAARWPNREL